VSKRKPKAMRGAQARQWLEAHPKAQGRLRREGSRYVDPLTKRTFSARQVLKVTTGYTPEQLAVERRFQRSGAKDAGENLERLIVSYQAAASLTRKRLLPRSKVVAPDSPFWQALRDLRAQDDRPTGRKARALVLLGLRDPESKVRVGHSPRGERPTTTKTRSQLSRRERVTGRR
jgi:hypothetical protein